MKGWSKRKPIITENAKRIGISFDGSSLFREIDKRVFKAIG